MISEELEKKILRQATQDLDNFLGSLSGEEAIQIAMHVHPETIAKLWHAAAESTLNMVRLMNDEHEHKRHHED